MKRPFDEIECPACRRKLLLPDGVAVAGCRCPGCEFVFPGTSPRTPRIADSYDTAVSMNDPPPPAQDPPVEEEPTPEMKRLLYLKEIEKFRAEMRSMDDGSESMRFNLRVLLWTTCGGVFGLMPVVFSLFRLAPPFIPESSALVLGNIFLWSFIAYYLGEPWFRREGQVPRRSARLVFGFLLISHAGFWLFMYLNQLECSMGTPIKLTIVLGGGLFVIVQWARWSSQARGTNAHRHDKHRRVFDSTSRGSNATLDESLD